MTSEVMGVGDAGFAGTGCPVPCRRPDVAAREGQAHALNREPAEAPDLLNNV